MRAVRLVMCLLMASAAFGFALATFIPSSIDASPGNLCKNPDILCPEWVVCEWEDFPCSAGEYHVHWVTGENDGQCSQCDRQLACLTYCPSA